MKASSHLTRSVFRALLSNKPYRAANCLKRPRQNNPSLPCNLSYTSARPLFSFITNAAPKVDLDIAKPTSKNLQLATEKLSDLVGARKSHSRAPETKDVISALNFLFIAHLQSKSALTKNEIFMVTQACEHLLERDLILGEDAASLSEDQLETIFLGLALPDRKNHFRSDTQKLATLLYDRVVERSGELAAHLLPQYAIILARTGSATQAQDMLSQLLPDHVSDALMEVARGFLAEGKMDNFWNTVQSLADEAGQLDINTHSQLTVALATTDKMWDAQKMFSLPVTRNSPPSVDATRRMLELYIRMGKTNTADRLAVQLGDHLEQPGVLESLLIWHSTKTSNPQELTAHIHTLLQQAHGTAGIDTFNAVIAYALKRNDPALAKTLTDIAVQEGISPDAQTFALQLRHAIDLNQWDIAARYYNAMLMHEVPRDNADIPILNKYIFRLAFAPKDEYPLMMRLVDQILERDADLDVDAVIGLCHVLLRRDDLDELTSILRHRIDFYPSDERSRISDVFRQYLLDPKLPIQRVANIYELFRYAFPETPASIRLTIMQNFFDRGRPDLATTVFSHMRQCAPGRAGRPNTYAYQKCFEGIASARDLDGLQSVYNMLKLDLQVELSTKIRNSIMLAYITCQMPWQAIFDHFYKIMDSREGPTYSTFEVALRACETWPPYGSFEARKIIAVMQDWNLEITKSCYDTYIGVMAGQCEFENTVDLIDHMEEDIGEKPDAFTIGTFYNAIPWQYRKDAVEQWAKTAYPALWEELTTYGEEIDEEFEVRYFKLDRSIDIDDDLLFGEKVWKPKQFARAQAQIEPLRLRA